MHDGRLLVIFGASRGEPKIPGLIAIRGGIGQVGTGVVYRSPTLSQQQWAVDTSLIKCGLVAFPSMGHVSRSDSGMQAASCTNHMWENVSI